MQFEEFSGQVQNLARLPSQGETTRAIAAVLETLGERLHGDEAAHLAAQLPDGLGAYLRLAKQQESFDVDEFFRRVAEREGAGVDLPQAVHHARAVITVLRQAVSAGAIDHVLDQLPEEWTALFEAGAEGRLDMPD
jgi:uncharacterized protein (DUF2267 family)